MYLTSRFDLDHVRTLRWDGWPHVLETQQFSAEMLDSFMLYVCGLEQVVASNVKSLNGPQLSQKIKRSRHITFLAEEGSTRTEATFDTAARHLGFAWKSVYGPMSSEYKGESVAARVMALTRVGGMGPATMTDYLIIRSGRNFDAHRAWRAVEMANDDGWRRLPLPVINAGDGEHQHPLQALKDLCSIYRERSCTGIRHSLDDLTLLICGDTKHSRTVNSLCHLLGKFGERHRIKILFCSHPTIGPKGGILAYLSDHGIEFEVRHDFERMLPEADVVYMVRNQRERVKQGEYQLTREDRERFVFRRRHLESLHSDAFVLHPLPINENKRDRPPEIDPALKPLAFGGHRQCAWARQSHRGVFVAHALIDLIEAGLQQLPEYPK